MRFSLHEILFIILLRCSSNFNFGAVYLGYFNFGAVYPGDFNFCVLLGILPISMGSAMVLLRRGKDGRDDMKRGGPSVRGPGLIYLCGD
jgi:hypothetical protein